MNRVHRVLLIAPALALTVGCRAVRDMVLDMVHVQRCVSQKAGSHSVGMKISGKRFTITLTNAPIDTLPAEARAAAARQVAECVRDNYRRYGSLNDVAVGFAHRTSVVVASVSTTTAPLVFTTSQLSAAPAADSAAARAPAPN